MNLLTQSGWVFPHEATFTHPSETVSALDGSGRVISSFGNDMANVNEAALAGVKPARHSEGYNVLFLDGHLKWLKTEKILSPMMWRVGD